MNPRTYGVHSIFPTIQGEGQFAGTPAVFVRLAGCNVWSGRPEDRERATSRGICAAWCDTEFRLEHGIGRLTAEEIVEEVCAPALDWGEEAPPLVVLTGGEPSLQVDADLVHQLQLANFRVHMESNGSRPVPGNLDWLTLSPKPPMPVVIDRASELKCVWPDVDPFYWRGLVPAGRVFLQPRDDDNGIELRDERWAECVKYVQQHPWCRLGLQTHKLLGIE